MMKMKRIEALADAFAHMYGALDGMSDAYHLRNPIMLKAFAPKHARDEKGRRVFNSFVAGYENALLDLKIKCSGKSRARLTPESPLVDLVTTYGNPVTATRGLVKFLRHALRDDDIPEGVKLGWFLEDQTVKTEGEEHAS
jgi:hypothetical protein